MAKQILNKKWTEINRSGAGKTWGKKGEKNYNRFRMEDWVAWQEAKNEGRRKAGVPELGQSPSGRDTHAVRRGPVSQSDSQGGEGWTVAKISYLDGQVQPLSWCKTVRQRELKALCARVGEISVEESNMQIMDGSVTWYVSTSMDHSMTSKSCSEWMVTSLRPTVKSLWKTLWTVVFMA